MNANFLKYVAASAGFILAGIAVGEVALTIKTARDIKKQVKKTNPEKEPKWDEAIVRAAEIQVERIKADPGAELFAAAGGVGYFIGMWFGAIGGTGSVFFPTAKNSVNSVMNAMRKYAPEEFNALFTKMKETCSEPIIVSELHQFYPFKTLVKDARWDPRTVTMEPIPDDVKEIANDIIKEATGV